MADERTDPLADFFTLLATPVAGAVRSVEQLRRGVDEFLRGVENFNRTMENLNATTERINGLLEELEPPLRAAIPQVTRTVQTADQVMQVISGPAMAVAPGLDRLAETLTNPAFAQLPNQLTQFSEVLGDVARRMGPLSAIAESAGGFLGLRLPQSPSRSAAEGPSSRADAPPPPSNPAGAETSEPSPRPTAGVGTASMPAAAAPPAESRRPRSRR